MQNVPAFLAGMVLPVSPGGRYQLCERGPSQSLGPAAAEGDGLSDEKVTLI